MKLENIETKISCKYKYFKIKIKCFFFGHKINWDAYFSLIRHLDDKALEEPLWCLDCWKELTVKNITKSHRYSLIIKTKMLGLIQRHILW